MVIAVVLCFIHAALAFEDALGLKQKKRDRETGQFSILRSIKTVNLWRLRRVFLDRRGEKTTKRGNVTCYLGEMKLDTKQCASNAVYREIQYSRFHKKNDGKR